MMRNLPARARAWKWAAIAATATLLQATGCQITNANELVAGWVATVAGTFITDYVNDLFNITTAF